MPIVPKSQTGWFEELAQLLRIPSISADPAHADDVRCAGEWVCYFIREAGGECELVDWHGQPLAIGEIRASSGAESAPTVLCYGHFDVASPDPLELWESDPFEPEIRGDYLFGRGAVDDKGPLYMLLAAARDALSAHDGLLVDPLRAGSVPATEEERAGWAMLPAGSSALAAEGARPN